MKKILTTLGALGAVLVITPMFAAFEAHVVNVTATIENALQVPLDEIKFGTVFPQEMLAQRLPIALSQSFLDEDRVDDVEYFIRQKPKCAVTTLDGKTMLDFPTATGHIKFDATGNMSIDCGPAPAEMPTTGAMWGVLPNLCPYISKHSERDNSADGFEDGHLNSFHQPWMINGTTITWTDVMGHLSKIAHDVEDIWTIDLAVPCFTGHCAQDWEEFVHGVNPDADPAHYVADPRDEHKVYGCDLWVEVKGVSLTPPPPTPNHG